MMDNCAKDVLKEVFSKAWEYKEPITIQSVSCCAKQMNPDMIYSDYKELVTEYNAYARNQEDGCFMPDAFAWFCKAFARTAKSKDILVPFASGLECDLFSKDTSVKYRFVNKQQREAVRQFICIDTLEEIPNEGKFDLIASALPLGPIVNKFISVQIVEQSVDLISENGYGLFTFAKLITSNISQKWLFDLEKRGIYCNAIIDMPSGSYAPNSFVDSVIVVFSRKKREKLFVALLEEESFAECIVKNFLANDIPQKGIKLGALVEGDIRCYSDLINQNRTSCLNKSLSKAYNGQSVKIFEIGTIHAPDKNNEFLEQADAIFIPKLGNSPVVTDASEFHIKAQNYFQVVVNTDLILPRYLAFFFNTEEGVKLRQLSYKGTTIKAFNMVTLGNVEVPCPPIEVQTEYLKTYEQLEKLSLEIENLKERFQKTPASFKNIRNEMKDINNTGDKFSQWIESLPYPIATILKRYSVADELTVRQEMLFYFFEAYAIFEATVLGSALNKKVLDCSSLGDVDSAYFEKASFGNWVRMDRALANLYLNLVNSTNDEQNKLVLDCFKTSDVQFIKLLCNRTTVSVLENTSKLRNLWKGHTGITSENLYREHVDTLDSHLRKLQESIKDLYERIRLIRPLSLSFSEGVFNNKVEVLTGSNSIFEKDTIISMKPLDDSKLYLQMIDTEELLELPPFFILKNSPADAKNACYFYSKVEGGNSRYVSYHYDGRPEDTEAGTAAFERIKDMLSI